MDTTTELVERDGKRVVYGYQPPTGERHHANSDAVSSWLAQQERGDDDTAATTIITGLKLLFSPFEQQRNDDTLNAKRLEDIGRAIAKSEHVRDVLIGGDAEELRSIFQQLAHNRSIERLTLMGLYHVAFDIFRVFYPFFEHNNNLRCIEILNFRITESIPTLISILSQSKMIRLEKIELSGCGIEDETAAELIHALRTMPGGLRNLLDLDLRGNYIQIASSQALSALLSNSKCRIRTLNLSNNPIDDVCIGIIIRGLAGAIYTLKFLGIRKLRLLTTIGWKKVTAFLLNPRCRLEKMDIGLNDFATEVAFSFGNSLANNSTMKYLYFDECPGWRELANGLGTHHSLALLLDLNLSYCDIDNESALDIFLVLANNTTLKKLNMTRLVSIDSSGWVACFELLMNSRSTLEELDCRENSIDNEGAIALVNVVARYLTTVESIDVRDNTNITADGWRTFAQVIAPSSTSKLKILRIGNDWDHYTDNNRVNFHNQVNDGAMLDFIHALEDNTYLRELRVGTIYDPLHSLDNHLISALCDATTISSIYRSNHTLCDIDFEYSGWEGDSDLDLLLDMNKDDDKNSVFRKKLLRVFSDVNNIGRSFGTMDTAIIPYAIECIGRDALGYSVMFDLCRGMPELFKGYGVSSYVDEETTRNPSRQPVPRG